MGRGTQANCTRCNERPRASKRNSRCRECTAEYNRSYYRTSERRAHVVADKESRRERNRGVVWQYLESHPCVDCGESDPIVLEFDHCDPDKKEAQVSALVKNAVKVETLLVEMDKCDVRCANCHRRKTVSQFNHWKARWGS